MRIPYSPIGTLPPSSHLHKSCQEIHWIAEYAHRKSTRFPRSKCWGTTVATQVFQITISTHPSLSGAFTWSSFISNTFVVRQSGNTRDENDTWHTYWNENDTWLLKSSDSICGTTEGYPAVKILTRIPGWIPWLEKKYVSRQKACSIPLKIFSIFRVSLHADKVNDVYIDHPNSSCI